jgi:formylglycine-generating enzyme required for sulfatase activity
MKTAHNLWRDLLRQVRLFTFAVLILTSLPLAAQVPSLINYQGRLTDGLGNLVSGNRTMAVRLYDAASGGNLTYEESLGMVSVANGTYSFQFGASGNGIVSVLSGQDYLALTVNGTEESTRTRLLAVPYALKAKQSEDAQALAATVAQLGSGVSSLETQASSIALELDGLGQNLTAFDTQISSTSGNLSSLEQRMSALEGGVGLLSGNLSSLSLQTQTLESQIEPINNTVSTFSSNMSSLGSQLAQSRQSVAQLQSLVAAMSEILQLGPPALPSGYPPEGMVAVRGGRLPSISELGPVNVGSFFIGRYEVWAAEWNRVLSWALTNGYQIGYGSASGGGHPIRNVSWYDVAKWCNAKSEMEGLVPAYILEGAIFKTGNVTMNPMGYFTERLNVTRDHTANGYRLPSAAEWEWAARGGVLSQNYTYSGGNNLDEVAWHYGNSAGADYYWGGGQNYSADYPDNRGTWPVGQKLPNELGLYDMSGNAWEWCDDLVSYTYESWSPGGGMITDFLRIQRGGSFAAQDPDRWSNVSPLRLKSPPGWVQEAVKTHESGFRVARNSGNSSHTIPQPVEPPPSQALPDFVGVQGGQLPSISELGPVNVGSFFIGRYEVWAAEWNRVLSWALTNGYQIGYGSASGGGHPIRNVSWYDVAKWCNAKSEMDGRQPAYILEGAIFKTGNVTMGPMYSTERLNVTRDHTANGYRLPSAAEWEWAARGGVLSQNYTYSGGNNLGEVAWHYGNSAGADYYWGGEPNNTFYPDNRGTWPVGQKLPNELGLYDMSGNVGEWCDDLVSYTYESWSPGGGMITDFYQIQRGGSFTSQDPEAMSNVSILQLKSPPYWVQEAVKTHELGFRIVYDVEP